MTRQRLALLCIAAAVALVVWRYAPPAEVGAQAPATQFSGARAMQELAQVIEGGVPHPVGSPANAAVRQRIVARWTELGLDVRTRRHVRCSRRGLCSELVNIVALRAGGPDVLLLAGHYDSVGAGVGAADDGSSVGALLEAGRMLAALPPSRNTVALLLSDGEEAGLLGAKAFVDEDPLWPRVRAVVNLEARGTKGPSLMFETAGATARLVPLLDRLERPFSSSLFAAVYEALPNDTDFSVFRSRGAAGFNFAFIDAVPRYHTSLDDLAHLDRGSLQHHGDNLWAIADGLKDADLGALRRGEDAVWFDVLGAKVLRWRADESVPLACLALALLAFGAMGAARGRQGWWRLVARALAWALLMPFVATLLGGLITYAITALHPSPMPRATRTLFPFLAMVGSAASVVLFGARRLAGSPSWSRYIGVWAHSALLGLVLAFVFPPACYLFVAPALLAGALSLLSWMDEERARLGATLLAGVFGLVLWFSIALGLIAALGLLGGVVVAAVVAVGLAPWMPLLDEAASTSRPPWQVALAFTVAFAAVDAVRSPFDAGHPQRMSIVHAQRDGRPAWWIDTSFGALPSGFPAKVTSEGPPVIPLVGLKRAVVAEAPAVEAPAVQARWSPGKAPDRRRLVLRSMRGAAFTGLILPPGSPAMVRVAGQLATPFKMKEGPLAKHRVAGCLSSMPNGCRYELVGVKPGDRFEVFDVTPGLPPSAAPLLAAREAHHGVPSQDGDLTIQSRTIAVP